MKPKVCTLVEHFSRLPDPRIDRSKRHILIDIIVIGIIGTLCGAKSWEEIEMIAHEKKEWLSRFLELPHGIPSHDTISRVFSRLPASMFESCFVAWMEDIVQLTDGEIVAIDGKSLRRSYNKTTKRSAIHMVSAWATTNGVVLGQVKVDDKSNEITAIPKLLDLLTTKSCVITLDAMGCQKDIASKIIDQKSDYVFGLKGNQSNTLGAVEMHFDTTPDIDSLTTTDGGHGRIETRCYQALAADEIPELAQWPGCQSAAMVTSIREMGDKKSIESRYYISSLPPDVDRLAKAIRGHWSIENSLHWVLDVVFDEDRSRVRTGESPENVAILRHMAINLLKSEKSSKGSMGKKRLKCCLSNQYLGKVLFGGN
jgi:predicted transposase YbfD/YdcC